MAWANSVPNAAFKFTMPQIIKQLGFTSSTAQLLTIPPYFCGGIAAYITGRMSDHFKWRFPFIAGPLVLLTVALAVLFSLATEVADWLVRKNVPFREAHEITGKLVALCSARDCELNDVTDEDLKTVSEHLDPSVREVLSVSSALAARTTPGSTGPGPVADQLAGVQHKLDNWRQWAVEKVVRR